MRRRHFLKVFGCAAAWPLSSFGSEKRHIAVLHALSPTDPEVKLRDRIFREALQSLGWFEPGNLSIENRYVPAAPKHLRRLLVNSWQLIQMF